MDKKEIVAELKKKNDAVILAHYYVPEEVQEVADFTGDSFALARKAAELSESTICFAGVRFMCESAKIINPGKTVLMPAPDADCPMAHMVDADKIEKVRAKYDDLAVVCYINSTAEIKKYADVIVTSSNAVKIVKALPERNIFFIPDKDLAHFVAMQCPDKNIIINDGFCVVHYGIEASDVAAAEEAHPGVKVLAHPECRPEVLDMADYVGSTSGIIRYAEGSPDDEFIVCTETGVFTEMKKRCPGKKFYPASGCQICQNMKKITLDSVIRSLDEMGPEIEMDPSDMEAARGPLVKMLEMGK